MSDDYIRFIPTDPRHIPEAEARRNAKTILQQACPEAEEISVIITEQIGFVDCGEDWERIDCPSCGAELCGKWWQERMNRANMDDSRHLSVVTPCCQAVMSLNDLAYRWPVGFARLILEVMNADLGKVSPKVQTRIEQALGCRVRVIYARY